MQGSRGSETGGGGFLLQIINRLVGIIKNKTEVGDCGMPVYPLRKIERRYAKRGNTLFKSEYIQNHPSNDNTNKFEALQALMSR